MSQSPRLYEQGPFSVCDPPVPRRGSLGSLSPRTVGKDTEDPEDYKIPVYFKPPNTLKHKLVHPKDKVARHKQNNVVYAIQCEGGNCQDSYIGRLSNPSINASTNTVELGHMGTS